MMQKAERIIYGTPVMTANMNMMRCFVLAPLFFLTHFAPFLYIRVYPTANGTTY